MALMEGNAEKLKTLINELGDSIQTSEFQELVEKIKSLIERLAKDPDMPELKAEIDGESVSKEELIKQLKAQCGQLIDQLKEQVARLNSAIEEEEAGLQTDSLLAGILTDEGSLNESQNVESETGHEAKDAKDGSAAFAKDADASNVKAGAEVENPFENIIIQNQQMPEKSPSRLKVSGNRRFLYPEASCPCCNQSGNDEGKAYGRREQTGNGDAFKA